MELGTLLASTGQPFSLLVTMEGFKIELESSRFASPPHFTGVADRPKNRADPPSPLTKRGGDKELQSFKKRVGPSRSRRNTRRWQAHLLSKESRSPLQAPTLAAGGGQASTGPVASSPAGAVAGTPATVAPAVPPLPSPSTSAAGALTKRGRGRPPKVRDPEKLRESYPHPDSSLILDYEEEERDERQELEVEVEMMEVLEEVEKVEANLETLCLQIIIMMNNDELAVAAAQAANGDPWDPNDPLCQAYLLKIDRDKRIIDGKANMRRKCWDFNYVSDEEEDGGEEEVAEES